MDEKPIADLADWKSKALDGTPPSGSLLRKQFVAEIRATPDAERVLDFTISTAAVDRDNDTIDPAGWEIANFLKNPVVLWAHDSRLPPIGRALEVSATGESLKSRAEFQPRDMNPFADSIFQMLAGGWLKATSVGFIPLEFAFNRERGDFATDFKRQELLEFSVVPIPANPEALIGAKRAGVDVGPIVEWAENVLEEADDGLYLPKWFRSQAPRKALEEAVRAGKGKPVTVVFRQIDGETKAEVTVGEPAPEPKQTKQEAPKMPSVTEKLREDLKRFRNVVRSAGDDTVWVIRGSHAEVYEGDVEEYDGPVCRALIAGGRGVRLDEEKTLDDAEHEAEELAADQKGVAVGVAESIGSANGLPVYRALGVYEYREPVKDSPKQKDSELDPDAIDAAVKECVQDFRMKLTGRLD